VTSTGTVASQYTYDPYGNQTTVSGTASDIGYAGYFAHAVSGLDFTLYRAYDPTHARWLNRDPIGERGGINLYAYADGNPVDNTDPLGLFITSVDAACAIDPQFCAEIIGQIVQSHGAITATETGNQCLAEEANRVANAFRTAGTIASVVQFGSLASATTKELNQIAHVFSRADKNIDALVQASGGDALNALRALQAAAKKALAEGRLVAGANGILPGNGAGAILTVNGVNVQLIGGRIINGIVELGSFVGL
jgi:RHS repeat-associated protein